MCQLTATHSSRASRSNSAAYSWWFTVLSTDVWWRCCRRDSTDETRAPAWELYDRKPLSSRSTAPQATPSQEISCTPATHKPHPARINYMRQAVAAPWAAIAWLARFVACAVNSNAINSTGNDDLYRHKNQQKSWTWSSRGCVPNFAVVRCGV